ncbi:MAG: hypothetical protein D3907_04150 [Candidatus Electrothrix sp. AUS3]|nr:hypothetical protein [Candidatus Electrothrix gigas]
MVFVAVLMAGGLYLAATAQVQWKSKLIGRHWNEDKAGAVNYEILPEKGQVVSGTGWSRTKQIRFWDTKNGKIFTSNDKLKNSSATVSSNVSYSGTLLLLKGFSHEGKQLCTLINLDNGEKTELLANRASHGCEFSESEQHIKLILGNKNDDLFTVALWSVARKKVIREISNITFQSNSIPTSPSEFIFSTEGNRLVVPVIHEEDRRVFALYDTISGKKINYLKDNDKRGRIINFELNSMTKIVCTLSKTQAGDNTLQLWSLDDNGTTLSG